jgi:ABC-type branched-subunit amino acid transport system substrate-binding protein
MSDNPPSYRGPEDETPGAPEGGELLIGLFVPDADHDPVAADVVRGAQLAVDLANASRGGRDAPIRLVRRWAASPWVGGAREVVRLIYEDRVRAVVGSMDSASTHVVEQVATKARVPVVSPIASDPSLTEAGVPWIFRLVPDDDAQAELLVGDAARRVGIERPVVVSGTDRQGRSAGESIVKALVRHRVPPQLHLSVPPDPQSVDELVGRTLAVRPDALFCRLPPTITTAVLVEIDRRGERIPVFLPWIPGLEPSHLAGRTGLEILTVRPVVSSPVGPGARMRAEYLGRWGGEPSSTAILSYDAVAVVVTGLREAGGTRAALRDAIARSTFSGAGGLLAWDWGGGRAWSPGLARIGPTSPSRCGSRPVGRVAVP